MQYAKGPKLPTEYQYNSTRHFMRELNRLGVTSVCDAGGGFQNYPEDYEVIQMLHERGEMTLRIAYNLFTQKAGGELEDFTRWSKMVKPGDGDDMLRCNGAGEMLIFSAADFEDFLEPRPDLPEKLEQELERVVGFLAQNRWPFRLHTTYDESISRFLTIFEKVNRDAPLESVLTILGGKPVYAAEEFTPLGPGDLPVMPDWSPVNHYRGAWRQQSAVELPAQSRIYTQTKPSLDRSWFAELGNLLGGACECFAF